MLSGDGSNPIKLSSCFSVSYIGTFCFSAHSYTNGSDFGVLSGPRLPFDMIILFSL